MRFQRKHAFKAPRDYLGETIFAMIIAEHHTHTKNIYIYIYISMRVNFDGHDVTSPYDGVPCPMFHVKNQRVSILARVYILVKNGRLRSNIKANLFEASSKKDVLSWTFYHISLGRSNNPSLNTDKKEFG